MNPNSDMEIDPDGSTDQVAVIMKGNAYRKAGLKNSKYPSIEGKLYDLLCLSTRHKLRDEVRTLALHLADRVSIDI